MNEKINKGITKAKKDKDNNLRIILQYISFINKNNKKVNSLLSSSLQNLKIKFDEKEIIIKYEEYVFNQSMGIKYSNILKENDINLLL